MKSVKTSIVRHSFRVLCLCSLMLAGCGSVTPTNQPTPALVSPGLSPTAVPLSKMTATPTEEIYPTFTPAPTLTAIPSLEAGQALTLTNIYMSDEQRGWGIDASEHIVHTLDGGQTWKDVTPPSGAYRDSGFFALSADQAWATPYQETCYAVHCPPALNNASVWHTYDGGESWQEQRICLQEQDCGFHFDVAPLYYLPIAIQFLNERNGWLLVSTEHHRNFLFQTTDWGDHWSPVSDHLSGPMAMNVTGMVFQDQQTGWLTTLDIDAPIDPTMLYWSMYQSTDAGLTWQEFRLPLPNPLPESFTDQSVHCGAQGIMRIPPSTLGVTIQCQVDTEPEPSFYEYYFHSPDGGKTWVSSPKTGDVEFINNLYGWRMTSQNGSLSQIEQTQDGGSTWVKVKTVQWEGDLEFVTPQVGWAIARQGDAVALVSTRDAGRTWQEIKPIIEPSTPDSTSTEIPEPTPDPAMFTFDENSFQMLSETLGWGTITLPPDWWTGTKHIVHTIDGGLNWQDVLPPTTDELQDYFILDGDHAWAFTGTYESPGYFFRAWSTQNGGQTWQDISPPTTDKLRDFFILDRDHAWILTETPADASEHFLSVWSTQNGGQTWKQATMPFSWNAGEVYVLFEDSQHGSVTLAEVAAGTAIVQLYKTSDGGLSWQELPKTVIKAHELVLPEGLPPAPDGVELSANACLFSNQSQTFFTAQEGIFQIICSGDFLIYHTHDGGQTWELIAYRQGFVVSSLIDFVDMNNGWYVTIQDPTNIPPSESLTNTEGPALYVTHDGGRTLREIIPIINISGGAYDQLFRVTPTEALGDFNFIDLKTGFAMADPLYYDYSVILKTTDGGYTWKGWVPHLLPAGPGH
jgi:photosystem II stability/assembly factor-like uncharacterized protein